MDTIVQPPLPSIQRGSGRPVVFLHGMALVPPTYSRMLDQLSRHVRVLSPMWLYVEGTWSEEAVVAALDATVVERGEGPVAVVGHSFGGALALLFTAARPDLVDHLVLVDAMGASTADVMRRNVLSAGRGVAYLAAARDFLGSVMTRPRDIGRAAWWGYRRSLDPEIDAIAALDLRKDVLWAPGDSLLPADDGRRLAERLGARFTAVTARRGDRPFDHDWPYRRPDRFVETLLELGVADR